MSDEQPGALELLAVARETLLDAVLPELSGDARYQALMIANAMAIASRELSGGAGQAAGDLEMLEILYGDEARPLEPGEDDAARAERLGRRLARDLRAGELDGGPQLGVRRLLRERVRARVAVSNPKRLEPKG